MDNHTANDPNNPINWNGTNKKCSECSEELTMSDFEEICSECFEILPADEQKQKEEEEERKELIKQFLKFPDLEE